jgi:hypothetical protein
MIADKPRRPTLQASGPSTNTLSLWGESPVHTLVLPNIVLSKPRAYSMTAVFGRPTAWAAELFALAPTGAGASGVSPSALRVLGGQVLFEGVDSSCDLGLWTIELLDVVLFEGTNTSNQLGLWETNGSGSGTFELAPIAGVYAGPTLPHRRPSR